MSRIQYKDVCKYTYVLHMKYEFFKKVYKNIVVLGCNYHHFYKITEINTMTNIR